MNPITEPVQDPLIEIEGDVPKSCPPTTRKGDEDTVEVPTTRLRRLIDVTFASTAVLALRHAGEQDLRAGLDRLADAYDRWCQDEGSGRPWPIGQQPLPVTLDLPEIGRVLVDAELWLTIRRVLFSADRLLQRRIGAQWQERWRTADQQEIRTTITSSEVPILDELLGTVFQQISR